MILKRKEKLNQEPKYWFNSRNILLLQKTGDSFSQKQEWRIA